MTETNGPAPVGIPDRLAHLTEKQQLAVHLMRGSIGTLQAGSRAEQWTAAMLTVACDAVERGYEAELVALVRAWRLEREREGGG